MDDCEFIFPDAEETKKSDKPTPAQTTAPTPPPETPKLYVDPAGLPEEGRALLTAIAGDESPDYNVMYGGGRFNGYADHPRIPVPIRSGPNVGKTSTAAGKYQFIEGTWDAQAQKQGLKDFTPISQDKAAWGEAQDVYKAKTGRDLTEDLKAGKINEAARALAGTWTSLPGGIEQGAQAGTFAARYAAALKDPHGPPPVLFSDEGLYPEYRTTTAAERQHTFMDATKAAFRYDTTIGILADHMAVPVFKPEPFTWTPELVKEKLGAFDKATQDWIQDTAVSPSHIDYLTNRAIERLDADKAIASQGFLGGAAAVLGAGLVDLPAWAAGGLAGKALMGARGLAASTAIGRVAQTAGVFAASAVPLEAVKYSLEPGYSGGDAAKGIAMAALFGGGFGAMGEVGGAYASRFRKFLDADNQTPLLDEATLGEKRAQFAAATGAEVAKPESPVIEPTRMDRFSRWFGGWADFSVGGKLYHSRNDLISELAPKLTTVATQDLTQGARDVEGARDFAHRTTAQFNARVEHAMREFYEPWAKEQGLNAWARAHRQGDFYEMARRYHTDPNWEIADVDPHVAGFVKKMRELFADHIALAKSYGLEGAKELEANDLYLPRYFNRAAWRAQRLKHGIEGIEDVVAQSIKAGDPEIAARVGSRVVGRAATRDAETALKGEMSIDPETGKKSLTPHPERKAIADKANTETDAIVQGHKADAKGKLGDIEATRLQDRASAKLDAADKQAAQKAGSEETLDPNSAVSREGIRQSIAKEIAHWEALERDTRDAAKALPEAAKQQRARLEHEANDIRDFHQSLTQQAEEAWAEAMERQGAALRQEIHAARTEQRIREQSADKLAEMDAQKVRAERDAKVQGSKESGKHIKRAELEEVKARYWLEAFNKRMAAFEDKFIRRVARKYVETVNQSIEGVHPDIDRSLSVRDTALLRDALRQNGIVVDEQLADEIADLIAPRSQRGPTHLRRRTVLDEHTPYLPVGGKPGEAFAMRDLMENDYEKIMDRYTRAMSPYYIMAKHGFQSESAARKYVAEVTSEFKGMDGYNDSHAYRDRKRANYLLDLIYGRDPLKDIDPKWRGIAAVISNLSYARGGGGFGTGQTHDTRELV
ncbi:MAG TPA: glycoside hydrolase family protein, partial [Rhodoblastus sp.]|nr:glycoside hydrolase family protein [Rhodoblastus sp.]